MDDRWLSVDEIADYLDVSKTTVHTWINAKGRRAHRVGGLWIRRKREEVDEWVRSGGATQGNDSGGSPQ
jgi:excisionase family DNA binding protein